MMILLLSIRRARLVSIARRAARAGDWSLARATYETAVRLQPSRPKDWVQLGHALKHEGNIARAEEAYRHAIALDPRWPESRKQLGFLLWDAGRDSEAISLFAQVLGLAGDDPSVRRILREAGLSEGAQEAAILDGLQRISPVAPSQRGLGRGKNLASWRLSLARKAARAGRWRDAVRYYGEIVKIQPNNAGIWVQLGHAYKHDGDPTHAEEAYRRAIALAPAAGDPLRHLGFLLRDMGKKEAARSIFQAARHALPGEPDIEAAIDELGFDSATHVESWHSQHYEFAVAINGLDTIDSAPPPISIPAHLAPVTRAELEAVVRSILAARKASA